MEAWSVITDTASIVLQDARIPFDHILGTSEVVKEKTTKGFKGAMVTFDATRPLVAATGIGVARASIELLKQDKFNIVDFENIGDGQFQVLLSR